MMSGIVAERSSSSSHLYITEKVSFRWLELSICAILLYKAALQVQVSLAFVSSNFYINWYTRFYDRQRARK